VAGAVTARLAHVQTTSRLWGRRSGTMAQWRSAITITGRSRRWRRRDGSMDGSVSSCTETRAERQEGHGFASASPSTPACGLVSPGQLRVPVAAGLGEEKTVEPTEVVKPHTRSSRSRSRRFLDDQARARRRAELHDRRAEPGRRRDRTHRYALLLPDPKSLDSRHHATVNATLRKVARRCCAHEARRSVHR